MRVREISIRNFYAVLKKMIAGMLCVCMLTQTASAQPSIEVRQAEPTERQSLPAAGSAVIKQNTLLPNNRIFVRIPSQLGTVEEVYVSPQSPSDGRRGTVYYIQDAHDSLEAQEHIAQIITHLVANAGVKTVFEEGYEGKVPTDEYFGGIPNPGLKEKVSYFLMDQLRLGGAEYAHINRFNTVSRRPPLVSREKDNSLRATSDEKRAMNDFELIGADSLDLHAQNIEWYQQSAKRRKETAADLKVMDTEIRAIASKRFSKPLKEWMKQKERFQQGGIDLLDYLKRLWGLSPAEITDKEYPNILSLLPPSALRLPPERREGFHTFTDAKALLREIDKLENALAEHHLGSGGSPASLSQDRKTFHYYKLLQLLKRLNAIEITEEEYEVVKGSLQEIDTQKMAQFITEQALKSMILSKQWERNIRNAIQFYETAHRRDRAIESALLAYSAERRADKTNLNAERYPLNASILVFGGFHKENIKNLLKRNGFSYVIITPKITQVSKRHQDYYKRLMSMGHHPFEVPLLVAKATATFHVMNERDPVRYDAAYIQSLGAAIQDLGDVPREEIAARLLPRLKKLRLSASTALPLLTMARSEVRVDRSGTSETGPKRGEGPVNPYESPRIVAKYERGFFGILKDTLLGENLVSGLRIISLFSLGLMMGKGLFWDGVPESTINWVGAFLLLTIWNIFAALDVARRGILALEKKEFRQWFHPLQFWALIYIGILSPAIGGVFFFLGLNTADFVGFVIYGTMVVGAGAITHDLLLRIRTPIHEHRPNDSQESPRDVAEDSVSRSSTDARSEVRVDRDNLPIKEATEKREGTNPYVAPQPISAPGKGWGFGESKLWDQLHYHGALPDLRRLVASITASVFILAFAGASWWVALGIAGVFVVVIDNALIALGVLIHGISTFVKREFREWFHPLQFGLLTLIGFSSPAIVPVFYSLPLVDPITEGVRFGAAIGAAVLSRTAIEWLLRLPDYEKPPAVKADELPYPKDVSRSEVRKPKKILRSLTDEHFDLILDAGYAAKIMRDQHLVHRPPIDYLRDYPELARVVLGFSDISQTKAPLSIWDKIDIRDMLFLMNQMTGSRVDLLLLADGRGLFIDRKSLKFDAVQALGDQNLWHDFYLDFYILNDLANEKGFFFSRLQKQKIKNLKTAEQAVNLFEALQNGENHERRLENPITEIYFPSAKESETLQSAVSSYLESLRAFGHKLPVIWIVEAAENNIAAKKRKMLQELADEYHAQFRYISAEKKGELLNLLASQPKLANHGLTTGRLRELYFPEQSFGTGRNYVQTLSSGAIYTTVDDDSTAAKTIYRNLSLGYRATRFVQQHQHEFWERAWFVMADTLSAWANTSIGRTKVPLMSEIAGEIQALFAEVLTAPLISVAEGTVDPAASFHNLLQLIEELGEIDARLGDALHSDLMTEVEAHVQRELEKPFSDMGKIYRDSVLQGWDESLPHVTVPINIFGVHGRVITKPSAELKVRQFGRKMATFQGDISGGEPLAGSVVFVLSGVNINGAGSIQNDLMAFLETGELQALAGRGSDGGDMFYEDWDYTVNRDRIHTVTATTVDNRRLPGRLGGLMAPGEPDSAPLGMVAGRGDPTLVVYKTDVDPDHRRIPSKVRYGSLRGTLRPSDLARKYLNFLVQDSAHYGYFNPGEYQSLLHTYAYALWQTVLDLRRFSAGMDNGYLASGAAKRFAVEFSDAIQHELGGHEFPHDFELADQVDRAGFGDGFLSFLARSGFDVGPQGFFDPVPEREPSRDRRVVQTVEELLEDEPLKEAIEGHFRTRLAEVAERDQYAPDILVVAAELKAQGLLPFETIAAHSRSEVRKEPVFLYPLTDDLILISPMVGALLAFAKSFASQHRYQILKGLANPDPGLFQFPATWENLFIEAVMSRDSDLHALYETILKTLQRYNWHHPLHAGFYVPTLSEKLEGVLGSELQRDGVLFSKFEKETSLEAASGFFAALARIQSNHRQAFSEDLKKIGLGRLVLLNVQGFLNHFERHKDAARHTLGHEYLHAEIKENLNRFHRFYLRLIYGAAWIMTWPLRLGWGRTILGRERHIHIYAMSSPEEFIVQTFFGVKGEREALTESGRILVDGRKLPLINRVGYEFMKYLIFLGPALKRARARANRAMQKIEEQREDIQNQNWDGARSEVRNMEQAPLFEAWQKMIDGTLDAALDDPHSVLSQALNQQGYVGQAMIPIPDLASRKRIRGSKNVRFHHIKNWLESLNQPYFQQLADSFTSRRGKDVLRLFVPIENAIQHAEKEARLFLFNDTQGGSSVAVMTQGPTMDFNQWRNKQGFGLGGDNHRALIYIRNANHKIGAGSAFMMYSAGVRSTFLADDKEDKAYPTPTEGTLTIAHLSFPLRTRSELRSTNKETDPHFMTRMEVHLKLVDSGFGDHYYTGRYEGARTANVSFAQDLYDLILAHEPEVIERMREIITEYPEDWAQNLHDGKEGENENKRSVKIKLRTPLKYVDKQGEEQLITELHVTGILFTREILKQQTRHRDFTKGMAQKLPEELLEEAGHHAMEAEFDREGRPLTGRTGYPLLGAHGSFTARRKFENSRYRLPADGFHGPLAMGFGEYEDHKTIQVDGKSLGIYVSLHRKNETKRFNKPFDEMITEHLNAVTEAVVAETDAYRARLEKIESLPGEEREALLREMEKFKDLRSYIGRKTGENFPIDRAKRMFRSVGWNLRQIIGNDLSDLEKMKVPFRYPHLGNVGLDFTKPLIDGKYHPAVWYDVGGWKLGSEMTREQAFGYVYYALDYMIKEMMKLTAMVESEPTMVGLAKVLEKSDPVGTFLEGFFYDKLNDPDFTSWKPEKLGAHTNLTTAYLGNEYAVMPPVYRRTDKPYVELMRRMMGFAPQDDSEKLIYREEAAFKKFTSTLLTRDDELFGHPVTITVKEQAGYQLELGKDVHRAVLLAKRNDADQKGSMLWMQVRDPKRGNDLLGELRWNTDESGNVLEIFPFVRLDMPVLETYELMFETLKTPKVQSKAKLENFRVVVMDASSLSEIMSITNPHLKELAKNEAEEKLFQKFADLFDGVKTVAQQFAQAFKYASEGTQKKLAKRKGRISEPLDGGLDFTVGLADSQAGRSLGMGALKNGLTGNAQPEGWAGAGLSELSALGRSETGLPLGSDALFSTAGLAESQSLLKGIDAMGGAKGLGAYYDYMTGNDHVASLFNLEHADSTQTKILSRLLDFHAEMWRRLEEKGALNLSSEQQNTLRQAPLWQALSRAGANEIRLQLRSIPVTQETAFELVVLAGLEKLERKKILGILSELGGQHVKKANRRQFDKAIDKISTAIENAMDQNVELDSTAIWAILSKERQLQLDRGFANALAKNLHTARQGQTRSEVRSKRDRFEKLRRQASQRERRQETPASVAEMILAKYGRQKKIHYEEHEAVLDFASALNQLIKSPFGQDSDRMSAYLKGVLTALEDVLEGSTDNPYGYWFVVYGALARSVLLENEANYLTQTEADKLKSFDQYSLRWVGQEPANIQDVFIEPIRRADENMIREWGTRDTHFREGWRDAVQSKKGGYKLVSVDTQGKVHLEGFVTTLVNSGGEGLDLPNIEVAPHNRKIAGAKRRFKGVGSILYARAVVSSVERGFHGWVYAQPGAGIVEGESLMKSVGARKFTFPFVREFKEMQGSDLSLFYAVTPRVAKEMLARQNENFLKTDEPGYFPVHGRTKLPVLTKTRSEVRHVPAHQTVILIDGAGRVNKDLAVSLAIQVKKGDRVIIFNEGQSIGMVELLKSFKLPRNRMRFSSGSMDESLGEFRSQPSVGFVHVVDEKTIKLKIAAKEVEMESRVVELVFKPGALGYVRKHNLSVAALLGKQLPDDIVRVGLHRVQVSPEACSHMESLTHQQYAVTLFSQAA